MPLILDETSFPPFRAFAAVFLSWFLSQFAKVCWGMQIKKRFNFRWLFGTGGMPSSHSATVSSLATAVGIYYGFMSMPFLIVLIFTLITMFDAAGVRRSVGKQAAVLNKMLDEFSKQGGVGEDRLMELLGHTPVEVFTGALVGMMISFLFCGWS